VTGERTTLGPSRSWPPSWRVAAFLAAILLISLLFVIAKNQGISDTVSWVSAVIGLLLFILSVLLLLGPYANPLRSLWKDLCRHARAHIELRKHLRGLQEKRLQKAVVSVRRLLKQSTALEPLSRNISLLSRRTRSGYDARNHFGASIGVIARGWSRLLLDAFMGDEKEGRILAAVFRTYAEEEEIDVSGKHPVWERKNFLVTNFVAYSKLVRAAIDETKTCYPQETLICRTVLAMPLTKWFNFLRRPNDILPFCEAHPDWDEYILKQNDFTLNEKTQVQRIVVAITDDWKDEELEEYGLGLHRDKCMRDHGQNLILVPVVEGCVVPPGQLIRCFQRKHIRALERHEARITPIYRRSRRAHIILPPYQGLQPISVQSVPINDHYRGSIEEFKWEKVWWIFLHTYHHSSDDSKYWVMPRGKVLDWFMKPSPAQRTPEDAFLVGIKKDSKETWLFGFAADVDLTMDRITLELISPRLNKTRFDRVKEYLDTVWSEGKDLEREFK